MTTLFHSSNVIVGVRCANGVTYVRDEALMLWTRSEREALRMAEPVATKLVATLRSVQHDAFIDFTN